MSTMRGFAATLLLLAFACAPSQSVDRVALDGAIAIPPDARTGMSIDPPPATGADAGSDATDVATADGRPAPDTREGPPMVADAPPPVDVERRLDAPVLDPPPDAPLSPDAAPDSAPPDTPPDAPLPRVVQLVVGDTTMLGPGDVAVRTLLATHLPGYTIRLRDDGGPVDLTNTRLIVIAGSVDSGTVGNKYRPVAMPVISLEYSLFDNLALTGPTENTDYGVAAGTQLQMVDTAHPLAASLTGVTMVVTGTANLGWGTPPMAAARIATLVGNPSRVAIFAFDQGAAMAMGTAPARRVGFFALETAAARLSEAGVALLTAAIDWALLE